MNFSAFSRRSGEQTCLLFSERARLAEEQLSAVKTTLSEREQQLSQREQDLLIAQLKNDALAAQVIENELRIKLLEGSLFGPKSEKSPRVVDPNQTNFLTAPVDVEIVPAASSENDTASAEETEEITYKRKKSRGRKAVSKELPTKEIILRASDAERVGPNGEQMVSLGFEITNRIDIVPERVQRLIIMREKLGIADTREYVATVAHEPSLVRGAKATDQFMLYVTLRKFVMGLPLYRQTAYFNRLGAELADNFLGECVRHVASALEPIAEAIRHYVLSQAWVFADETPIKQLSQQSAKALASDQKKVVSTCYMWAWVGGNQVYFHHGPTRSAKEVRDVLGIPYDPDDPIYGINSDENPADWQHGSHVGFVVCDGYSGYNPLFKSSHILRAACWAHARRPFQQIQDYDKNAARVTLAINQLFKADKEIAKELTKQHQQLGNVPPQSAAWHAAVTLGRQRVMPPLIEELKILLEQLRPLYNPDGVMSRAINYITNRWDELEVFINHGCIPLDNNTAERAIRPIAVGRKNWLFVGSEDGGKWAATTFSIIESCRLQKVNIERYCEYVLAQIVQAPDRAKVDYSALTPAKLRSTLR